MTKSLRSVLVGVSALAMVAIAAPAMAGEPVGTILRAGGATAVEGSYIVVLKDSVVAPSAVGSSLNRLSGRHGGSVARTFTAALRGAEMRMDAKAAARMAADTAVAYVEQNHTVSAHDTQTFPPSYGLDRIDQRNALLDNSYTYPSTASNVTAYIIDSGIRTTHSDFGGRASWGVNTTGDGINADCNGHGTHVAGTVGGATFGVAKGVRLVAVKVLGCGNTGSIAGIIDGVNWVVANAAKPAVANMSLGGAGSVSLDFAVTRASDLGVTMVVSAGNDNTSACNQSPARATAAITVGSTITNSNGTDDRSFFSNFGSCLDLFAPGQSITSAGFGSDTASEVMSGTSMSSPHVAGAAALVLAGSPTLIPGNVRTILQGAATKDVVANAGSGSPNLLLYITNPPSEDGLPGNCTTSGVGTGFVSSLCTTGTGEHRVHALVPAGNFEFRHFFGPWVGVGQTSSLSLVTGLRANIVQVDRRSS